MTEDARFACHPEEFVRVTTPATAQVRLQRLQREVTADDPPETKGVADRALGVEDPKFCAAGPAHPLETKRHEPLDDYAPPRLLTYPLETVVAEKFEAAIDLAEANSRMKDFRDLYVLAVTTPFDGAVITEALKRTFERRETSLSSGSTVMTEGFARNTDRDSAWAGYLRKERIETVPSSFEAVMPVIRDFIGPPFHAAGAGESFGLRWDPESRRWH